MTAKTPTDQRILDFLKEKGTGTVDEICAAVGIGRTSARKYLAGLTVDKKVNREPGGRDGRRKLPDVFSLPGKKRAAKRSSKRTSNDSKQERLGPGRLDKLVLGYMRRHKKDAPHTPSAIAKGIERSSGAVANCLARQEEAKKVRLVNPKPRRYELAMLGEAGYRRGGARTAVVEALARHDCAVSALALEDELRRRKLSVGRASIYRALELLEELRLVQRFEVERGIASYERVNPNSHHHHHAICRRCGRMEPFEDRSLERVIEQVSDLVPFEIAEHDVVLRGLCERCAN